MNKRNYSKEHHDEDYFNGYKIGYREGYQDGYKEGYQDSIKDSHSNIKRDLVREDYEHDDRDYEEESKDVKRKEKQLNISKIVDDLVNENKENIDTSSGKSKGKVRVELRIIRNDEETENDEQELQDENIYEEQEMRYSAFDHFFRNRRDTRDSKRRKSY